MYPFLLWDRGAKFARGGDGRAGSLFAGGENREIDKKPLPF